MEIAKETDLPDLLESLGYQVRRVGSYHTTKEMDSLRIKNRRTWFRYSEGVGGDAITFLQRFCGKSFPEAVEYLLDYHGWARDSPAPQKSVPSKGQDRQKDEPPPPFALPLPEYGSAARVCLSSKRGIAPQVMGIYPGRTAVRGRRTPQLRVCGAEQVWNFGVRQQARHL
ncbi:MAG: hypothetical protein V8S11_11205 [Flavonifractor plautii]